MKQILIPIVFMLFVFAGATCKSELKNSTVFQPANDSLRTLAIQTYIDTLDVHREEYKRLDIRPNFESEEDRLLLFMDRDNVLKARLDVKMGDSEIREYYFLKEGKIVFYQQMYWSKQTIPPYAWGVWIYMDKIGVCSAKEKFLELSSNERPAGLILQPDQNVQFDLDSMVQVLLKRWEPIAQQAKGKY